MNSTKWKIGWGITSECNMRCFFCYSKYLRESRTQTIFNINGVINFINNNKNYIDSINFGTGECALIPEWWDLLMLIKETNPEIKIGVTTNGTLFSKDFITSRKKTIAKETINDIDISIDYADQQKHNYYRGNKNAFSWALDTLKCCEELSIEKTIVIIATQDSFLEDNLNNLRKMTNQYNCNLRINIYRPINETSLILPIKQFYDNLSFLCNQMKVVSLSDPLISSIIGEKKYTGDFTGQRSFRILDDGYISPSTYLISERWKTVNIFTNPSIEIRTLRNIFKDLLPSHIPRECSQCVFEQSCMGGAIDRRWLWFNSFDKRDPYCPYNINNAASLIEKLKAKVNYSKKQIFFVHDGYLPTIILANS
jgi:radical SAM protein with 4Fe4S-binding SPASM domain